MAVLNPVSSINIELFPNPFYNNFNLRVISAEYNSYTLKIYSAHGLELYNKEHQSNQYIELGDDLSSGMYLLKIINGDDIRMLKISKE